MWVICGWIALGIGVLYVLFWSWALFRIGAEADKRWARIWEKSSSDSIGSSDRNEDAHIPECDQIQLWEEVPMGTRLEHITNVEFSNPVRAYAIRYMPSAYGGNGSSVFIDDLLLSDVPYAQFTVTPKDGWCGPLHITEKGEAFAEDMKEIYRRAVAKEWYPAWEKWEEENNVRGRND